MLVMSHVDDDSPNLLPTSSPASMTNILVIFRSNMPQAIFLARTPQELVDLSEKHGLAVPLHLSDDELMRPASKWTLRYLIAYRVLVDREESMLETFRSDHGRQCPVCISTNETSQQQLNQQRTIAITDEPCPANLLEAKESNLMQLENGTFWVALARAIMPEQYEEKSYPGRARKSVERPDFVSSATAILGTSSPTHPSSSEFEISLESIDEDRHDDRRSKPEEITVNLITIFLQHSLCFCLDQEPTAVTEVRTRIERLRSDACINGRFPIVAEDDGGISRMKWRSTGWSMENPYLALIEAKRAFKHFLP
jgi:hypothetical protein